jgi:hypothetical protein
MQREGYWDYMGRRLREEQVMHNSLHLKLDDTEKIKISAKFNEVDFLKNEVYQLQESLQNSYVKIKELRIALSFYESRSDGQMEFEF